jgi:RNA polymerase sigma-70 factor (ECF subfamily)
MSTLDDLLPKRAPRYPTPDPDVLLAQQGDRRALDTVVARYQPGLYRIAKYLCGNPARVDDVVQETMLAMVRYLATFRGETSFATWLYTIARRQCARPLSRSKHAPRSTQPFDEADFEGTLAKDDDPFETLERREQHVAIERALGNLRPDEREILVLRDIEGLSARESADVLGIGLAALKSRLHRARLGLRAQLLPDGERAASESACAKIDELFSRHLEGDLESSVCTAMKSHVDACTACRTKCSNLKHLLQTCIEFPEPEIPARLAADIRSALAQTRTDRT